MHIRLFTLFLALTVFNSFTSHAQAPVTLRLNVKPNDQFLVKQSLTQEIHQVAMGQDINITQQSSMSYGYDIASADEKEIVIKATFEAVQMDMTTPQGNLSVDSEQTTDTSNPLKPVADMVGKSFFVFLTPIGEVNKVEGFTAMFEAMNDEASKQMVEQFFNDESMAKSFEAIFKIYPVAQVKRGDSWENTVSATTGGMLTTKSENTYTLYEVANDEATIDVQSTIAIGPAGEGKMMGMDMTYDLNGMQTGKIIVDIKTGMANDFQLDQTISGAIKAQGMTIPMTIKTTSKFNTQKL